MLTGDNWSSLVKTWKGESIHRNTVGTAMMIMVYSHSGMVRFFYNWMLAQFFLTLQSLKFTQIIFKNSVLICQETQRVSTAKTTRLMLFTKVIVVYSKYYMKYKCIVHKLQKFLISKGVGNMHMIVL